MSHINILNTQLVSKILTEILLCINLPNHRRFVENSEKGKILSKYQSSYEYMKAFLQKHPKLKDTIAVIQDRKITYGELWSEVEAFSNYLHFETDCKKGEIISVCAASSIEGIVTFFALNKLGIISGRVFNGSQTDKMKYNICNFDSRVVLIDNNNLQVLLKVIKQTKVKTVILMSKSEENLQRKYETDYPEIQFISYKDVLGKGKKHNDAYEENVSAEDMAAVLYTSGSSGEPKPISIPNRTYINMLDVVCSTTNIAKCDGERVIGVVSQEYPYANINCTIMVLMMGKTLIMPVHNADKSVDFAELLEARPNRIQAIPNFYKLWETAGEKDNLRGKKYRFLKSVISGGEQYLKSEKEELLFFLAEHDASPLLIDGFGFGELGSAAALKFGLNDYFLLLNGIEAKAVHPETKKKLSLDEEGILCFTGPTITGGYYNNAEQTQKCFVEDEKGKKWFISDTYGAVHGRTGRLIKLGGRMREYFITDDGSGNFVKVYAGTVEDAIMSCSYVRDCIVVPSDSGATPSPVAYIAINEEAEMDERHIIENVEIKCRSLERFAQPIRYEIEKKIVRTKAGKKDYGYYRTKQQRAGTR